MVVECEVNADWAPPIIVSKFPKLYNSKQKHARLDTLKPERIFVMYPDVAKDIEANIRYKFIYREVRQGSRHLPEARQKAHFKYGQVGFEQADSKKVVTIHKTDFRPFTYRLRAKGSTEDLVLNGTTLNFDSPGEALFFLEYLNTYFAAGAATSNLKLGSVTFTSSNLKLGVVKVEN